jgi:hypothetical protein
MNLQIISREHIGAHINISGSIIRTNCKAFGFAMTSSHQSQATIWLHSIHERLYVMNDLPIMPFEPSEIAEFKQNTSDDPHIRKLASRRSAVAQRGKEKALCGENQKLSPAYCIYAGFGGRFKLFHKSFSGPDFYAIYVLFIFFYSKIANQQLFLRCSCILRYL